MGEELLGSDLLGSDVLSLLNTAHDLRMAHPPTMKMGLPTSITAVNHRRQDSSSQAFAEASLSVNDPSQVRAETHFLGIQWTTSTATLTSTHS